MYTDSLPLIYMLIHIRTLRHPSNMRLNSEPVATLVCFSLTRPFAPYVTPRSRVFLCYTSADILFSKPAAPIHWKGTMGCASSTLPSRSWKTFNKKEIRRDVLIRTRETWGGGGCTHMLGQMGALFEMKCEQKGIR